MTKPLNNADNQPKSLMDIVDEAYGIVDRMIDEMRQIRFKAVWVKRRPDSPEQQVWDTYDEAFESVLCQLKDLRSLLGLAESFRDYEEEDKKKIIEAFKKGGFIFASSGKSTKFVGEGEIIYYPVGLPNTFAKLDNNGQWTLYENKKEK